MNRTTALSFGLVVTALLQVIHAQSPTTRAEIDLQAGHTTPIWALAASPDGRLVASAAVDRTIKLWSLADARLLRTFDGVHGIEALAFSPDGRVLASADDNQIALFDVRTGATIRRFAACDDVFAVRMLLNDFGFGEPSRVIALAFNPSGKFLASACDGDASVKAWDFGPTTSP